LRRDGLDFEGSVVDGEACRGDVAGFEGIALDAVHAAGIAAEQEADGVVDAVALVDADFLAAAAGEVDHLLRGSKAEGVFEEGAEAAAEGGTGDDGASEGILDDGVIGAADFERAFAGADVEAGEADERGVEDEFASEANFGNVGRGAHGIPGGGASSLLVVGDDGFEEIAEAVVAAGLVAAGDLEEEFFQGVEAAEAVAGDGIGEAGAEHDELVLAFGLGGAAGAADGAVEAAELGAGTGVEIAEAGNEDVGLVVEVEAVGDEFVVLDFDGAVGAAIGAAVGAGFAAAVVLGPVS
jgi:hypothetical protein